MPIVLKGRLSNMKLNGFDDFKQHTDSGEHINGTDYAQNFPSGEPATDHAPECSICGMSFDSVGDSEIHFLSVQHAKKVLEQNSLITLSSDVYDKLTNPLKNQSEKMCLDEIDEEAQEEKSPGSSKTDNKAFKPPGLIYFCSDCNKECNGPEPYKQHLESKSHKKKVAIKNNWVAEVKKMDGHIFCDTCEKEFTGEKPYNEHLFSKKHKRMEQHLQSLGKNVNEDSAPEAKKIKLECQSEIDKQYFCKTCEMVCSGAIPYKQHLAGNAHKKNVARSEAGVSIQPSINQLDSLQTNDNSINCVSVAAENGSDLACSENMKQGLDDDSAPKAKRVKIELTSGKEKQWFCDICKIQCSGPAPFNQHLNGKDHLKNVARSQAGVNIQLSVNQFNLPSNSNINLVNTVKNDSSDQTCPNNIANIYPTLKKIEAEREECKLKIDLSKPAWFCKVCNVQCTGSVNFSDHLGGKSHKKKELYQKKNYCDKPKDPIGFDETKSSVNESTGENNLCSLKQNMCSESTDYEEELKKESVEIFSPDEEIKFN